MADLVFLRLCMRTADEPVPGLDGIEIPYTCDGCMSVTWLPVRITGLP